MPLSTKDIDQSVDRLLELIRNEPDPYKRATFITHAIDATERALPAMRADTAFTLWRDHGEGMEGISRAFGCSSARAGVLVNLGASLRGLRGDRRRRRPINAVATVVGKSVN